MVCPSSCIAKTYVNNNQQEELGMVEFHSVNKFMMTSTTTQPEPLPQPSTILWGNQSPMSGLNMSHREFQSHLRISFRINEF